jgi:hypothetical protein
MVKYVLGSPSYDRYESILNGDTSETSSLEGLPLSVNPATEELVKADGTLSIVGVGAGKGASGKQSYVARGFFVPVIADAGISATPAGKPAYLHKTSHLFTDSDATDNVLTPFVFSQTQDSQGKTTDRAGVLVSKTALSDVR